MTAEQIRAARAILRWTQKDLAERAGLSPVTIKDLEASQGPIQARMDTVRKVRAALEGAGIRFIEDNGKGVAIDR